MNNNKKIFKNKVELPEEIITQVGICKKYNYKYKENSNGNIYNNTTFYASTITAHAYQIEKLFKSVIEKAKKMPEIFGHDFECNFRINHVKYKTGEYVGHAFIDVSNPKLYYALLGKNIDGSDNVKYIDDPEWKKPVCVDCDWGDIADKSFAPKIKIDLPPLLTLDKYEFDEEQIKKQEEWNRNKFYESQKYGFISISPAYITSKGESSENDCQLYVRNVPYNDSKFLYNIFSRYSKTPISGDKYYPYIKIHTNKQGKFFAIVKYQNIYDTAFALMMCQRIIAEYNGETIEMYVRYAKNNGNNTQWVNTQEEVIFETNEEQIDMSCCCEGL